MCVHSFQLYKIVNEYNPCYFSTGDSIVTSSLLNFTNPKSKYEDEEKAGLSGYILDENSNENSFDTTSRTNQKRVRNEIFPTAILDSNDELTNLYKTISRKQILSKVQCSPYGHGGHPPPPPHHHLDMSRASSRYSSI